MPLINKRRLNSLFPVLFAVLLLSGCGGGGGESASGISIAITPSTANLHPDETQQFAATVSGTGNTAVTWQVQEGAAAGSVDANGLYTAPTTPGTYHVIAVSQADASKSASSVVTVIHSVGSVSGAPGTLDSTFGTSGKVITPVGFGSDSADGIIIQPDGKFIVTGDTFNGSNSDFFILRYNADGTLDTTFGSGGKVLIDFGLSDIADAVALDSVGRIVIIGNAFNGSDYDFAVARYDSQGRADTSFGINGKVITSIGSSHDFATALAIRSDNSIFVAGSSYNGTNYDFALVLYDNSGHPDSRFGNGGKVTTPIGNNDDFGLAVGLQSDGKIVIAGNTNNGQDTDFALVRYTTAGAVDITFGTSGKVVTPIGTNFEGILTMLVQSNKIVVAGYSINSGSGGDIALARYNLSDGTLDTTFGNQGKVVTAVSNEDEIAFTLVQSGSNYLVAGYSSNGNDNDFVLASYNSNGSLNPTFGTGGVVITSFGTSNDSIRAAALQGDGKILAIGESVDGNNRNVAMARYNPDGSLDSSFAKGGKQTVDFDVASSIAQAIAIQSDGKIITAGDSFNGENFTFTLVRYDIDGKIDSTFGDAGKVPTLFDGGTGGKIVIRPDGEIFAAGTVLAAARADLPFDGNNDFIMARYSRDGTLEDAVHFGFGPTPDTNQDYLTAIALQPDGKILLAGHTLVGTHYDFALARLVVDAQGELNFDPLFGAGGQVITSITQGDDFVTSIALQSDGKILLAGYSVVGSTNNFVLARYNADGSLDTTFSGGTISATFAPGASSVATAVQVQPDGKIVVGGYSVTSNNYDFALARYNPDGSLDSTFGTAGKVVTVFDTGNDGLYDLALQADGKIVAAGFSNVTGADFAVARYKSDGTLDPTFGQGGKRTIPAGQSIDFAYAVALQADGKIVAAGGSLEGSHYDFALIRLLP